MDIYKCPKMKIQKNFPLKNLNILYNKLNFLLKAEKKKGFSFLYFFILNTYLYVFLINIHYFVSNRSLIILNTCHIIVNC
jgi:hypothetical protein